MGSVVGVFPRLEHLALGSVKGAVGKLNAACFALYRALSAGAAVIIKAEHIIARKGCFAFVVCDIVVLVVAKEVTDTSIA